MKRFTLTTVPLICAAVAPLCADMGDHAISQADASKSSRMQNGKQETDSQKQFDQRWRDDQITPSAKPKEGGVYISADFIWWKAQEDGLEYAWTGAPLAPTAVPPDATPGKMLDACFKYEPGFKVGLGYKFERDSWDLYAEYTWIRFNHEHDEDDDDDCNCCPEENTVAWSNYWLPSEVGPIAVLMNDEERQWKLHFNALDVELGRNFYISKWLTLRPHFGLKFSWMQQHYDVEYEDILFRQDSSSVIPVGSEVEIEFDQHQFGVGIRAGLNTAWYFTKWLALYGDVAVTSLWNRFREKREDTVETATGAEYESFDIKRKTHPVTAVLELGLGLRFEWAFCNEDYLFQFEAGWEEQVWFNQNQFITVEDLSARDLSLEGLTLKAAFYF